MSPDLFQARGPQLPPFSFAVVLQASWKDHEMPQVCAIQTQYKHLCKFCAYVCMPVEARGEQQVSLPSPLYLLRYDLSLNLELTS